MSLRNKHSVNLNRLFEYALFAVLNAFPNETAQTL